MSSTEHTEIATPTSTSPLDYAQPATNRLLRARPLPAVLLCTPGLFCWIILLGAISGILSDHALNFLPAPLLITLLVLAVITALVSLPLYIRRLTRLQPWYVYFNLVINISGMVFVGWAVTH